MYVIKKSGTSLFASWPGMHNAYTPDLLKAWKFKDMGTAQANCCGNEYVVNVAHLLGGVI